MPPPPCCDSRATQGRSPSPRGTAYSLPKAGSKPLSAPTVFGEPRTSCFAHLIRPPSECLREMVCVGRIQIQVLYSVVLTIAVPVMDNFLREEPTTEAPLHHQTVLPDVAVTVRIRVARARSQPIAVLVLNPASSPRRIPPSRPIDLHPRQFQRPANPSLRRPELFRNLILAPAILRVTAGHFRVALGRPYRGRSRR